MPSGEDELKEQVKYTIQNTKIQNTKYKMKMSKYNNWNTNNTPSLPSGDHNQPQGAGQRETKAYFLRLGFFRHLELPDSMKSTIICETLW